MQIQREVDALAEEIQRISAQTEFNTKNLPDGSLSEDPDAELGTQQFQVGANEGQTIEFNVNDLGTSSEALDVAGNGDIEGESFDNVKLAVAKTGKHDGTNDKGKIEVQGEGDDQKLVPAEKDVTVGGKKVAKGTVIAESVKGSSREFSTTKVGGLDGTGKFETNVAVKEGATFDAAAASDLGTKANDGFQSTKLTTKSATAQDITLTNSKLESGEYTLSVADKTAKMDKTTVSLTNTEGDVVASQKASKLEKGLKDDGKVVAGFKDSELAIDGANLLEDDTNTVQEDFAFTSEAGETATVGGPEITTPDKAAEAITTLDEAISEVSSERSELGALQNRLETTISVDDITAENLEAARSRIRDADVAQESVKQTRGNILVQAGTSVLAQANQNPQAALQLLGG